MPLLMPPLFLLLFERLSRILAEQGIATLRVEYRDSGDSDGTFDMTLYWTAAWFLYTLH